MAQIVGRDVHKMDANAVAKAALESLAESFNDGVVAPALWYAVGGLPALYAFKAINTADSMIGHLEARWRRFGWASAKMDDLVNLAPSRIAGLLLVIAGGGGGCVMVRDAPRHASPNAGWPEAAMAGALKVQLGGPVAYDGAVVQRPVFNAGAREPCVQDLRRGLSLYRSGCALLTVGISENRQIAGTYVHGVFERRTARAAILSNFGAKVHYGDHRLEVDRALDEIATMLVDCVNIRSLLRIADL